MTCKLGPDHCRCWPYKACCECKEPPTKLYAMTGPTAPPVLSPLQQPDEPRRAWPDPTPEMLDTEAFERVWQCIKRWDINVPGVYVGYMGATGNHVRAILDALELDAQRATVARLEAALQVAHKNIEALIADRDFAMEKNVELEAKIKRLRIIRP